MLCDDLTQCRVAGDYVDLYGWWCTNNTAGYLCPCHSSETTTCTGVGRHFHDLHLLPLIYLSPPNPSRCHGFQEDVHFISRTPFPRATGLCHSSPLAPVFERHPDLTGGFYLVVSLGDQASSTFRVKAKTAGRPATDQPGWLGIAASRGLDGHRTRREGRVGTDFLQREGVCIAQRLHWSVGTQSMHRVAMA